ncbi:transglutaminase [Brevibacterium aurantiacum]|nr:transglutaminase [Brevibacterium aurantiacum]
MDRVRFEAGEAMSTDTRESTEKQSPALLEACTVFVAMVLAAVGLSAVFSDFAWLPPVLISIFLIVIVGAIFRSIPVLRATGAAVIAQCLVGLIAVLVLCAPSTLILGVIPTGSSFTSVIDLLSSGVSDLYATVPPAPSTPGFTTMLTIAFTLITILIDGLVCDLKAPKVSGVLLLVLWMIPVFFAPTQVQWWHVVAILAAFLILMLSPYLPAAKWRGGLTATVAGAVAVAIGIGLPVLLPEVPSLPNRAASDKGDLTVTNPFLDLRADLGDRDDSTLFDYTSTESQGQPIRLTSINSFDGQTWAPTPFPLDSFAIANEGLPWPQGLPRSKNYSQERIDVSITDEYDQQYLPSPYAPQQPTGLDRRWIYDEKSLTVVGNGEKSGGQDYSMEYVSINPDVKDLQSATPVNTSDFETELEVPDSLPTSVKETAEKVTADADNQWEAAVLLQAYFRSGDFEYSLDAPERASGDAISDFLVDKKGYCVQFSSAMTIMARTMGIPARIGVGFGEGSKSGEGYEVSMQDSHAWPELYFEGAGWVRFEPTPGGPAGDPPKWSVASGSTDGDSEEDSEESSSPSEEPTDGAEESEATESESSSEETSAAGEPAGASIGKYLWAGLIVLVILLLAAIPALWRLILRRRRTSDPKQLEKVWTEVRALSTDYGQSLDPSKTLRFNELVLASRAQGGTEEPDSSSAESDSGADSVSSGTRGDSGDQFTALRSPAPPAGTRTAGDDTALSAFVDALEAHRYGGSEQSISSTEVSALIDEVRSDLSANATSGSRITARIWPASIFNPPR